MMFLIGISVSKWDYSDLILQPIDSTEQDLNLAEAESNSGVPQRSKFTKSIVRLR